MTDVVHVIIVLICQHHNWRTSPGIWHCLRFFNVSVENQLTVHRDNVDFREEQMRMLRCSYHDGDEAEKDESQGVNSADITAERRLHQRLQTLLTGF